MGPDPLLLELMLGVLPLCQPDARPSGPLSSLPPLSLLLSSFFPPSLPQPLFFFGVCVCGKDTRSILLTEFKKNLVRCL